MTHKTQFKIGSVTFQNQGKIKGKNVSEIKVSGGLFLDDTLYIRHSKQTQEYYIEFVSSEDPDFRKMLQIPAPDPNTDLKVILKEFIEKFEDLL